MKSFFLFSIFLLISYLGYGQKICINKVETSRDLEWTDFLGPVDKASSYQATTWWEISYSMKGIQAGKDSVQIAKFEAVLNFNPSLSWVKTEHETTELLKHEQVHFDIGKLCLKEFIAEYKKLVLEPKNYSSQIRVLFNQVLDKYKAMQLLYDQETNHSQNMEQQIKWNAFVSEQLNKD